MALPFAVEVGEDILLPLGVLGGDIQKLSRRSGSLTTRCVDELLTGTTAGEGADEVSISDIGEPIVPGRETLDVFSEGLILLLPTVARIP